MTMFRRDFTKGRMNTDATEQLLPQGEYREATNAVVIYNEGEAGGAIQKSLSFKRLTNLPLGGNPITLGVKEYEARDRIYWLVKSDSGCYLIEWDNKTQSATFVLQDTRPPGERVFDLNENYLCTGWDIIPNDDPDKEMMLLTDDNMQPLRINISRAKTYGPNGFEKEDIYNIKKPPRFAPKTQLVMTSGEENYLEEEFTTFSYRYKYLDGEYSALSDFTNYQFEAGPFELDFQTVENLAMTNIFNAVNITVNTGDKRVTDIEIIGKKSNSNTIYLIESFNKENEGWDNDVEKQFTFANEKIYQALPERELYRAFDNVPRKAKAQTVIGNKVVYGNYLENYNMTDIMGRKIKPDYTLSLINNNIAAEKLPVTLQIQGGSGSDDMLIDFTDIELNQGTRISFFFDMKGVYNPPIAPDEIEGSFQGSFDYVLPESFANIDDLAASENFGLFVTEIMTSGFNQQVQFTPPPNSTLEEITPFTALASGNILTLVGPVYTYKIDNTPDNPDDNDFTTRQYEFHFYERSEAAFRMFGSSASLKTNRSYEPGIIYMDEFGRRTTVLTSKNNTIYIPQKYSTFQNKIKITLNNLAPAWADRYKFVVKQNKLTYFTIFAILFFEDGLFRWVRLDGANKDKVKEGDTLIVKSDLNGPVNEPIKVRVLEVTNQPENFLSNRGGGEDSTEVLEEAGLYMKIKPFNFAMDTSAELFFDYQAYDDARSGKPVVLLGNQSNPLQATSGTLVGYFDEDTQAYVDYPILPGTRIFVYFRNYESDGYNRLFETSKIAAGTYDNFQDWWEAEIGDLGDVEDDFNYEFIRVDPNDANAPNALYLRVQGNEDGTRFERSKLSCIIRVQLREGILIFETDPKPTEEELYYETEQCFEIVNGLHTGNIQDQDIANPAIIELDFFNCFAMGDNGAESYRIKDVVNNNYLNIDLRPSTTQIAEYAETRRFADLTYSEAYVESTNINGLNVFNLSTANFKDDMEKQYGSIQKLHARLGDIVVFQEEGTGKVLFDKDAITSADGADNLITVPGVLGRYLPYAGSRGIGLHPESFSIDDDGRIKFASVRKGVIARLSNDGIEDIVYGMKNFWRKLFLNQPNAKIISGYDPYLDQTVFAIGNEPIRVPVFNCSSNIIRDNISEPFTYDLRLNNLGGDIIINYNITSGTATIQAEFDGDTYVASGVTGIGNLSFERTSLVESLVRITVTPVSSTISYTLGNVCPVGSELKIVFIVLNDADDTGQTMTNRFRWQGSQFYSTDEVFTAPPLTRFETVTGLEGIGQFPANGTLVTMQAFKDTINSGHFALSECNRMGYLVSDTPYDQGDVNTILDNANFITVTTTGEEGSSETSSGNFLFSRDDVDDVLYMIWDYTSRNPVVSDDTANVNIGQSVIINVLDNDEVSDDAVVTIGTQPNFGTAVVNPDTTITYTHDGSENLNDSFTYVVTDNGCSSTATVTVNIGISCGDALTAAGGVGIYKTTINFGTATGFCGIQVDSQSVPDRWELYWNGNKVADTKYTGDGIDPGPPTSYTGLLGEKTLSVFEYNGTAFVDTGVDETITIVQDDVSNNTTEPTDGAGFVIFNKTLPLPATVELRTTGPVGGTAWNIRNVICPTPDEELIGGSSKFVYGFYTEPNKGNNDKSIRLWLNTAEDRFYTNMFGQTNFNMYGEYPTNRYVNDGIRWWQINADGTIISTGLL